jgi:uncharacterized damage-inducible protein DinB
MDCRDLVIDGLSRVDDTLRAVLRNLSAEQLAFRPGPRANSIGWLAWHLTRVEDDHVSELDGQTQAWTAAGWHARFGRPANTGDTGYGDTPEDVGAFRVESPAVLLEYYAAVHERSLVYLARLSCEDMDRIIDTRWNPPVTVGVRLVSVVNDTTQHVGQMAYIRGLIADGNWSPF